MQRVCLGGRHPVAGQSSLLCCHTRATRENCRASMKQQMVFPIKIAVLVLLGLCFSSAVWGQAQTINTTIAAPSAQRPCQHEVPTYKAPGQQKPSVVIRSISMAPDRESATIEMVNQSAKTVTAYAYIADTTYTDGQHCVSEMMQERIGVIAMEEAGHRHITQASDELLLPGAVHEEVYRFGGNVNEVA